MKRLTLRRKTNMDISAIKLVRLGDDAVVLIESNGYWSEVIREPYDACYSHIVEEGGMRKAIEEQEPHP